MSGSIERASALYAEGLAAFRRGDRDVALRLSIDVLRIGEETGDDATIVRGLIGLSRVAFRDDDHARLRDLCERALPHWKALTDRTQVASPIHMLAESARMQRDLDNARALYDQSFGFARADDDAEFEAMELNNLAFLELQAGDPQRARGLAIRSLRVSRPSDNNAAYVLLALGAAKVGSGDASEGAMLLALAEKILNDQGTIFDPGDQPLFERAVADARAALGGAFEEAWQHGRAMSVTDALDAHATGEAGDG